MQLWPELDKAVIRSFARAIPAADATQRPIGWYFTQGRGRVEADRKVKGATPHDLGAPNEVPFDATNYTAYQDCNLWKDLASDYVLQVWRTFKLAPTGEDLSFLAECWPAAVQALLYLKQFEIMEAKTADHRSTGGEPKGKAQLAAGGAKGQHRSKAILRCFLHKQGRLRHGYKGQAEAGQH